MIMRSDENPILERIEKVLAELSRTIASPNPAVGEGAGTNAAGSPAQEGVASSIAAERLNTAIAWIRARARRDQAFGEDLFFDPAWSILLELYVHHRQRTATSITSLCLAAKVPPSTGLRWVALLEKRGLVVREADPFDKRKSYARLTMEAVERVERALDDTMESNRQLGIERVRVMN
ncbi:winged helix DNA-binding protein [Sphingomonas sp. IC4-52]|uniref:winged helix DNA-binding protein n=1 Tax=Sphingomonas sp. IC4-52 TaxID=2887202 RepID=UPI001D122FEA|nr:winged helix DNA-binding protein [Sphingomonas sp. IC4-52]MCC2980870.1 winged helix DNA-binding protein [Sphingomonas sp. IC4-52]